MATPWILVVYLLAQSPAAGPADAPSRLPAGLGPGDSFALELKYSNDWEAADIQLDNPQGHGRPLTPAQLKAIRENPRGGTRLARPELRFVPRGNDPLVIEVVLRGAITDGRRLVIVPAISLVHYFDDRGRDWTLSPSKEDVEPRATEIIRRAASTWTPDLADTLEKEMLEEQLLGAGVALLHDVNLEAAVDPETGDGSFPEMERLVAGRLPREFPEALRGRVGDFWKETLARTLAPPATWEAKLAVGRAFEARGISYKVEKLQRLKDSVSVRLTGSRPKDAGGRTYRENTLCEPRTGLIIESSGISVRDSQSGPTTWVGATRWSAKLLAFKKAKPPASRRK